MDKTDKKEIVIVPNMGHTIVRGVKFHPKAKETLRGYNDEAQLKIGKGLRELQLGRKLGMPNSRPMPSVGKGVEELRVRCADGAYRAFYYFKDVKIIYVFHIFKKKTEKTSQLDIQVGIRRLKDYLNEKE